MELDAYEPDWEAFEEEYRAEMLAASRTTTGGELLGEGGWAAVTAAPGGTGGRWAWDWLCCCCWEKW